MYGLLQQSATPSSSQIEESLDGNLCRCTGYRPILAAFHTFAPDHVDVPLRSHGACCQAQRDAFPDIEELGVLVRAPYNPLNHSRPSLSSIQKPVSLRFESGGNVWLVATSLPTLQSAINRSPPDYMLVRGNTSTGVYPMPVASTMIDVAPVKELYGFSLSAQSLTIGANETLSALMDYFQTNAAALPPHFARIRVFMKRIASFNVRNIACWAGNLAMANLKDFTSDLLSLFCAANAT